MDRHYVDIYKSFEERQSSAEYKLKAYILEYAKRLNLKVYPYDGMECPACHTRININTRNYTYNCQNCGDSGDIYRLVELYEKITERPKAISHLLQFFKVPGELKVITLKELMAMEFPYESPVISGLLPSGTYIFAGAPKIGKSWLVLWFAQQIALGQPIWDFETTESGVLYLALEDKEKRLKSRAMEIIEETQCEKIYFATESELIGKGLEEQLLAFINKYPDVRLIIIDTLQKICQAGSSSYSYSSDYDTIGRIKKFGDDNNITFLIVHHTRKENDDDSFNTISGTTGLLGCADGAFVLKKNSRIQNLATFEATGRDIPDIKLNLEFNQDTYKWNLISSNNNDFLTSDDILLVTLSEFINENNSEWKGTASELIDILKRLSPSLDIKSNVLSRKLNANSSTLFYKYHIKYQMKRENNTKNIILMYDMCDMSDNPDVQSPSPL